MLLGSLLEFGAVWESSDEGVSGAVVVVNGQSEKAEDLFLESSALSSEFLPRAYDTGKARAAVAAMTVVVYRRFLCLFESR